MKIINGLYLDPRSWQIDCMVHQNWNTEKFGINIDLYSEQDQKLKKPLNKDYKFVIATEVWSPQAQEILKYFKQKYKLFVFLLPREQILAESYKKVIFKNDLCEHNGDYCFIPDIVLSPAKHYSAFWTGRATIKEIGHPKFDSYAVNKIPDQKSILRRYKLKENLPIIYFPMYWDKHYQYNGKVYYTDIGKDLEKTLSVLEKASQNNFQIISKMHPTTQKLYNKNKYTAQPTLKKYYNKLNNNMKIIKDERHNPDISREIMYISDLIVSFRSTMLLEATIIKKPVINIMFEQCSALKGLPDFINHIKTITDEKMLLKEIMGKNYNYVVDRDVVGEYCGQIDGNFCQRMCAEIRSVCG